MPLNKRTTTDNFYDTELVKPNAKGFSVDVSNQYVQYQVNAAIMGRGDNWVPSEGIDLGPGYWTFDASDWQQFGVDSVQGIRFRSAVSASPAVVSVS